MKIYCASEHQQKNAWRRERKRKCNMGWRMRSIQGNCLSLQANRVNITHASSTPVNSKPCVSWLFDSEICPDMYCSVCLACMLCHAVLPLSLCSCYIRHFFNERRFYNCIILLLDVAQAFAQGNLIPNTALTAILETWRGGGHLMPM